MHRTLYASAAVLLTLAALASSANATTLFSTRGNGPITDSGDIFIADPAIPGATLEDAGLISGGSIDSIRLGYYNNSSSATSVDALVTFYDTVNYAAAAASPVATNQIGSTYRLNFSAQPGVILGIQYNWNETGLLSLTGGPLALPDSSIGVMVKFVNPNTNTLSTVVVPTYHDVMVPPTMIGSSNALFAADFDGDNSIVGGEIASWFVPPGDPFPDANLYLELGGTVPEPASLSLLALGGLVTLRRRRA